MQPPSLISRILCIRAREAPPPIGSYVRPIWGSAPKSSLLLSYVRVYRAFVSSFCNQVQVGVNTSSPKSYRLRFFLVEHVLAACTPTNKNKSAWIWHVVHPTCSRNCFRNTGLQELLYEGYDLGHCVEILINGRDFKSWLSNLRYFTASFSDKIVKIVKSRLDVRWVGTH